MISSYINLIENCLDVADNVGIEAHSKDHPDNRYNALIVTHGSHITITHCRQCLKCPIHTGAVLMSSGRVH